LLHIVIKSELNKTQVVTINHFVISGALLLGCAVFNFAYQEILLVLIILFYPYVDKSWHFVRKNIKPQRTTLYFLLLLPVGILMFNQAVSTKVVVLNLFLAAIPEEWFFRAYFQTRLQYFFENKYNYNTTLNGALSITISSLLFASLHSIMQANALLLPLIFIPSIVFGFIYYKTQDLTLVILSHLLSNIILVTVIDKNLYPF